MHKILDSIFGITLQGMGMGVGWGQEAYLLFGDMKIWISMLLGPTRLP